MAEIDRNAAAREVLSCVRGEAGRLEVRPGLALLLVEDGWDSRAFSAQLEREGEECGIYCEAYTFPAPLREEAEELLPLLETRGDLHWAVLLRRDGLDLSGHLSASLLERLEGWGILPETIARLTPEEALFRALLLAGAVERAGQGD